MYSIYQIAKWFLLKEENMSNKKLQKLCWYAYSWHIFLNSDPEDSKLQKLIDIAGAEAWLHGPTFRDLYMDYRYCNYCYTKKANIGNFDKNTLEFLERIWSVYGHFDGYQLEEMTHNEKPWINARKGVDKFQACTNLINDYDVFEKYLNR